MAVNAVDLARLNLMVTLRRVINTLGALRLRHRYLPKQRKMIWKAFDANARKWEKKFAKGAVEAFENDRREILAIINAGKKKSLENKATIDWVEIKNSVEEYLATAAGGNWRKVFAPLVAGIIIDQGGVWSARLGTEFDVQNLQARDWFNQYMLKFAQPVNETTSRNISQIMERAQAEGSSIPDIQDQLEATFERYMSGATPDDPDWQWFTDRAPAYRRELIARTETIRASNAGTHELFKEWGVKKHEWLSTQDDRTRTRAEGSEFEHLLSWPNGPDGEVREIDEPFTGTGEPMLYPGDPNGSIGNFANCRCTLLPVVETGEELQPEEPPTEEMPIEEGTPLGEFIGEPPIPGEGAELSVFTGTDNERRALTAEANKFLSRGQDTTDSRVQGVAKDTIVKQLEQATGLNYNDINDFIRQWAGTSNDTDMRSLHIQQMAAELFDTKLSEWQLEKINMAKTEPGFYDQPLEFSQVNSNDGVKELLREMYKETQAQLKDQIEEDYLILYRGAGFPAGSFPGLESGGIGELEGNALESWTSSEAIANTFATGDDVRIIFQAKVPVSMIVGSARTGFGCLDELEYVVMGGKPGMVKAVNVRRRN